MRAVQSSLVLRAHAGDKDYSFHYTAGELSAEKSPVGSNQDSSELQIAPDRDISQWKMLLLRMG